MYNKIHKGVFMEKQNLTLSCLKEEIRVFRKNENATYDIFALYKYLVESKRVEDSIGTILVEKVISDLEDEEVTVSLKAENIGDFLDKIKWEQKERIRCKFQNVEECYEILNSFKGSSKESMAIRDLNCMVGEPIYSNFNLIHTVFSRSTDFTYQFLTSNIELSKRTDMFILVLQCYNWTNFYDFISKCCEKQPKIEEIIEEINKNRKNTLKQLFEHLVSKGKLELIENLTFIGLNFNLCFWDYFKEQDEKRISAVGYMVFHEKQVSSFKTLYENETYLQVPKSIRENDDFLVLEMLYIENIINKLLKLKNFEITEEKVRKIADRVHKSRVSMNATTKYNIDYLEGGLKGMREVDKEITETIIRKAKNKEEYKRFKEYASIYECIAGVDNELERLKRSQNKKEKERKDLEAKRKEFSTLLFNLSEYTLDNFPARRLIKEIPKN